MGTKPKLNMSAGQTIITALGVDKTNPNKIIEPGSVAIELRLEYPTKLLPKRLAVSA
jgi:hypothetical protein